MADNTIGKVIITFIIITLGILFLQEISNTTTAATDPYSITNETLMINNSRAGSFNISINGSISYTLTKTHWYSIDSIINATGGALTEDIDYVVHKGFQDVNGWNSGNETIYFLNTTATRNTILAYSAGNGNKTLVSYHYIQAEYVNDTTSRTFISLIVLFFTIGLIIITLIYIFGWDSMKEMLGFQ